jgi:hypothetical protein
MQWLCVTRTCCTVSEKPACYENVTWSVRLCWLMQPFGKLLVASCCYFPTTLWQFECLVFNGQSLIDIQTYFQKIECPLLTRMDWVLVTQHWERNISEKESGTCLTYVAVAPNQTLTAVVIHGKGGQDHTMHIFLYLILTIKLAASVPVCDYHTSCMHIRAKLS